MNQENFIKNLLAFSQLVIDILICRLSFFLVTALRPAVAVPSFTFEAGAFLTGTIIAVFWFNSLYDFKNWVFWDEMKAVLKSCVLIILVTALYLYSQSLDLSRFVVIAGMLVFVPLCLTVRYVFRRVFYAIGLLETNIIILGAGRTGEIFAEKITQHPFTACKVIGFLDDDPEKQNGVISGVPVLGRLEDFTKVYETQRIDEAAVAISTASRSLLTHILDIVEFHVKHVHYIPDMYMLTTFSASIRDVEGMPVISASQGLFNPLNRAVKSVMDYAGAALAVIIFSPFMIYAAFKIKREDNGPVLFVQQRIGRRTKPFNIFKFRTHTVKANKASQTSQLKTRFTRTGRILHRTSIADLPQLFNVLRGEMSLVGPSPLVKSKIDSLYGRDTAGKICMIKPGITGFYQVSGRNSADKDLLREMNLYYIRNWSLWLDIVILLRTVYAVFRRNRS